VLKSFLKASIYIACLACSGVAYAAGLGGINVTSALGQPLKAEIEVVSIEKVDKSTLRAKLASVEAYKSAGLDYPYSIPKLKFQFEERANGEPYIRVTSIQPVNEPFVSLMIELSWSAGKLLREYTFLLDPVDYQPEQPKAAEVKPIEPILAAPIVVPAAASEPVAAQPVVEAPTPAASAAPAAEAVAPAAEVAPAPEVAAAPVAESAVPAAESAVAASEPAASPMTAVSAEPAQMTQDALSKEEAIAEPIMTKRGDTLSKIALQNKASDVSLERMLVALYRANAEVFDGKNMNRLKTGKILRLPDASELDGIKQNEAVKEIRAQVADWNVYRQKLAAARGTASESADKQEAAGKVTTAVMDKAPSDKEPAKEVLKLSKGEAPGDQAVGGGKASAQDKANAKEEEAIAKNKALKEAQERTAILEKNVKDMQRLADLKKQTEAEAPQPAASAPAAVVTMGAAASSVGAASGVEAAKPKAKPAQPKVVTPPPSMIDDLLADPMYLAGGAALLLLLGGAGFVVARRSKGAKKEAPFKKKDEDVGSSTGRIAAPIAPSPDTGDFTPQTAAPTAVAASNVESEEVDPIGEADLFLTFGRDAQAEEVLKEALHKNPNNIPVKLKLLSIYVSRKDTNSFYSYAREIKESGDESAWELTAAMGRELEPSNPFYGGDASAAPAAESKAVSTAAPAVDFDLGFGSPAAPSAAPEFTSQNTVVLEAPAQEKTAIMSAEELRAATATPMDFDITGTHPGVQAVGASEDVQDVTSALNMDDLVFDVTTTHSNLPLSTAPAPAAPAEDAGLAFTLDFPSDFTKPAAGAAKPAPVVPDIGLGEISLNLDNFGAAVGSGSAEPKDERWHEVATKLDLAKAYQEMGDVAGAREILEEVLRDGDQQQRDTAQTLMQQL
jgi:pilus assembly protein FimV